MRGVRWEGEGERGKEGGEGGGAFNSKKGKQEEDRFAKEKLVEGACKRSL